MRRKIAITNHTHWQTGQLRRFIERVAREVLNDDEKPTLSVTVVYNRQVSRGYCSGRACIGGAWLKIMLPSQAVDKIDLAHVIAHELGHCHGLTHADMRGSAIWTRSGRHREIYAWASELPLEKKQPKRKKRLVGAEHAEAGAQKARRKVAEWTSYLKRAQTALKKWRARRRYYERRAVAIRATGREPSQGESGMQR